MKIGLIDVDRTNFPNLALMKIAAYHKKQGDEVKFAYEIEAKSYDRIYISKVFNFTPDYQYTNLYDCEIVKGGTGYDLTSKLPDYIDRLQPDYSLYQRYIDDRTSYGFLTRGCPNKCKWCVVPIKEGHVTPYMDIDEITQDGRRPKAILMDNNILACDYGIEQIDKIILKGYRVDFNQALDARLVTDSVAKMLSKVKWLSAIRFGCDTPTQIVDCERAMAMIDKHAGKHKQYLLYTIINNNIDETYNRLSHFRANKYVRIVAQPFRDFTTKNTIPQWQHDIARWANRRELWTSCDFKDFRPRKNFSCNNYFNKTLF